MRIQDRISLIPEIPTEAAYFWKHPALNKEALFLEKNSGKQLSSINIIK